MFRPKRKILFPVILLGVALTALFFSRREITCEYSTGPRSVFVGDPVTFKLNVYYKKDVKVKVPDIKNAVSGFDLISAASAETDLSAVTVLKINYILTKYVPGEYVVPELKLEYLAGGGEKWNSIVLPEVKIKVKSTLPDGFDIKPAKIKISGSLDQGNSSPFEKQRPSDSDINEMVGPIRFKILEREKIRYPENSKELILKTGIFICAGVVTAGFLVLIRKIKAKLTRRRLSPLDQALANLDRLKKKGQEEDIGVKEYCAEVNTILLLFLRDCSWLDSKEMVFEELREQIVNIESMGYEEKKYLLDLLKLCEEIKYAPEEPEALPEALQVDGIVSFVKKVNGLSENDEKDEA